MTAPSGAEGADDPFERLGLAPRFDLASEVIDAAHRRLVLRMHPDRIVDPLAQAEAARTMALINTARSCLLDEARRADALLRRLGGPAKEDDRTLPDGFLIEMMERREAMEEALADGDGDQRAEFVRWASDERAERLRMIAAMLAASDPESLRVARLHMNALRYVERMAETLADSAGEATS